MNLLSKFDQRALRRYGNFILLINLLIKFDHCWSPCRYGKSIFLIYFWPHLTTFDHDAGMVSSLVNQMFDQSWIPFLPKVDYFYSQCRFDNFICWSWFKTNLTTFDQHAGMVNPFCWSIGWPSLTTFDHHACMVRSFFWSNSWPNFIKEHYADMVT